MSLLYQPDSIKANSFGGATHRCFNSNCEEIRVVKSAQTRPIKACAMVAAAVALELVLFGPAARAAAFPMESPATDCTGDWGGIKSVAAGGTGPLVIGTSPTGITGVDVIKPSNPGFATVRDQFVCVAQGTALINNPTNQAIGVTLSTNTYSNAYSGNLNNICSYTIPVEAGATVALPLSCMVYGTAADLKSGFFENALIASGSASGLIALPGTNFSILCCPGGGM
jgi:hypothetical protein